MNVIEIDSHGSQRLMTKPIITSILAMLTAVDLMNLPQTGFYKHLYLVHIQRSAKPISLKYSSVNTTTVYALPLLAYFKLIKLFRSVKTVKRVPRKRSYNSVL